MDSAYLETIVGKGEDFKEGEIKEVKIEDKVCVVVKDKSGEFHALSGKCTHYGAPLSKGSYADGIIRCPWHGACFSAETGDIEDFPGLDSLHKYQAKLDPDTGEVKVRISKAHLASTEAGHKRRQKITGADPGNGEVLAIIGGGGSAQVTKDN